MPRTSMNTSAKRKQNCNRATLLFSYLTHFINPPSWNNHIPFFYVQNFHPDACNEQNRAPPIKCISMTLINEQNWPTSSMSSDFWTLFSFQYLFNIGLSLYISPLVDITHLSHDSHLLPISFLFLFLFGCQLDLNWVSKLNINFLLNI